MTVAGGAGHTLPYTPPVSAVAKVMLGGALVLAAGILIGGS